MAERAAHTLLEDAQASAVEGPRTDAVRAVASRLVCASLAAAAERGDDWEALSRLRIVVSAKPICQAYSLADGTIILYEGALDALDDEVAEGDTAEWEAGVARLLSHEIAHLAALHGAERANALPVYAALAAALPLAPVTATAAAAAWLLGSELPRLRHLELEADAVGARMMKAAGYDPKTAVLSLRHRHFAPEIRDILPGGLDEMIPGIAHTVIPSVFSSHPTDCERADTLEAMLDGASYASAAMSGSPLM